jgi:hypothetical protein
MDIRQRSKLHAKENNISIPILEMGQNKYPPSLTRIPYIPTYYFATPSLAPGFGIPHGISLACKLRYEIGTY